MDDSNPTLTDTDLTVLAVLRDGSAGTETLAERAGLAPGSLDDRLEFLTDNGLVRATDGAYELTDSGRQVLRASGDGAGDSSPDVPPEVVEALEDRGLRADRLDAVCEAFAFLRYWGRATAAELKDGAFSEAPLEYETAEAWWTEFVRDHLAAAPMVEPAAEDGEFWTFAGTPGVADLGGDDRSARSVRGADDADPYASATEALIDIGLTDDERLAATGALAALQRGTRETAALRRAAKAAPTDDPPSDEWLDTTLFDVLDRLPGVVRTGEKWDYTLTPEGYSPSSAAPSE